MSSSSPFRVPLAALVAAAAVLAAPGAAGAWDRHAVLTRAAIAEVKWLDD